MAALKTIRRFQTYEENTRELYGLVLTQLMWIAFIVLALWMLEVLTLERFFVLWYFGFLLSVHLFAPTDPGSKLWRTLQAVVITGFLGLCYFVAIRANEIVVA